MVPSGIPKVHALLVGLLGCRAREVVLIWLAHHPDPFLVEAGSSPEASQRRSELLPGSPREPISPIAERETAEKGRGNPPPMQGREQGPDG
jgi:hypothetical protein